MPINGIEAAALPGPATGTIVLFIPLTTGILHTRVFVQQAIPEGGDSMAASQWTGNGAGRLQYVRMDRSARDALRLLRSPGVDALVVIDGDRATDGAIIGIVTERDIFRAMAVHGLEALDNLVWMLAKEDFTSVDVGMSQADRLKQFCAHKTDHIAVTDGFVLTSVQSIWNCLDEVSGAGGPAQA
ncbi:CBS domain-containing protein [Methylobacterium sp. 10]|uniref:CBS domain-containing protein n=1 Tax=Methylobacterium sp. 10 TaxID=1101191 RepID=UPI001FD88B97|nr:CBS domain-containing protein [Methylobacterium sp. 10]